MVRVHTHTVDFWSQLPTDKRQLMQNLFLQYRNQQIDYRQFLANSRQILGESLYNHLYQRLSAAAKPTVYNTRIIHNTA